MNFTDDVMIMPDLKIDAKQVSKQCSFLHLIDLQMHMYNYDVQISCMDFIITISYE